jgi:hypothetical protein
MGHATCRAICRLASQESPRLGGKKTGSARRAGCAHSRLCPQPAGDSTVEGRSRAMKTKAHQRLFRQKWAGPGKSDRGQGRE